MQRFGLCSVERLRRADDGLVKLSPDQIAGSGTTAKLLVDAYNLAPDDQAASQGLGLLALMVGIAE